jgi:putative membrane protein
MKESLRHALLSVAIASLVSLGAAAQNSDQSNAGQSSSTPTQDSSTKAGKRSHHAKGTSEAGAGSSSQLGFADRHFVKKAAEANEAEVELGKLATEKGQSDDVKKFGQRMIDDHSKANDQLKQVASSKGVDVPNDLSAKDKATKDRLSKLSGEKFDRAYMNDMVKDHTKDVAEFRRESKTAKDPDVKNFAAQTLPTLEDHLKEARSLAPKERKEAKMEGKKSLMKSDTSPKY